MARLLTFSLGSTIKTFICFWTFCCILPAIISSYLTFSGARRLWIKLLASRYPWLEFAKRSTYRSLVETFRNKGIFSILLHCKGQITRQQIREKLLEVLNKKDKNGRDCYPRLKLRLTTCWGAKAWIKGTDFKIDDHIIFVPAIFRGRQITENNIQDYVSQLISKFMPSDIPQWQIFVIPANPITTSAGPMNGPSSSSEEPRPNVTTQQYYMLLRIHHLLLEEEPELPLSDLLLLEKPQDRPFRQHESRFITSPFGNLFERPTYIPRLINCIQLSITNRWNEFVYCYDPLESPDMDKKRIETMLQLITASLIVVVTVSMEFYKGFNAVQDSPLIKLRYFQNLLRREVGRRNLSWTSAWTAFLHFIDPVYTVRETFRFFWWFGITIMLVWPCFVYMELRALVGYLLLDEPTNSNTIVGFCVEYIPLIVGALFETIRICSQLYQAPRTLFELFEWGSFCDQHSLQKISLCGRKVISWSDRVNVEEIREVARRTKLDETEVALVALSGSLKDFFQKLDRNDWPTSVDITAGCISLEYLISTSDYYSGLVCLNVPIASLGKDLIRDIHSSVTKARLTQTVTAMLSQAQAKQDVCTNAVPGFSVPFFANYLSSKYPITLTEVCSTEQQLCRTVWGEEVRDLIYLPPTQANLCLSLVIQRYANHLRLGVISDAQISPSHTIISKSWKRHFQAITGNRN